MATIRELYLNAGNPNFDYWKDIEILSLAEASLLTCAVNPLMLEFENNNNLIFALRDKQPINWMHSLMMMRALTEAIATHKLKSPLITLEHENEYGYYSAEIEQARVGIDNISNISYSKTRIHKEELHKWLKNRGYFDKTTPIIQSTNNSDLIKDYESRGVVLLPEPVYTTPLLDIVNAVVDKFWKGYNPDKAMVAEKQIEIERWIKENYPETSNNYIAKAIDRICRHPSTKTGGNKKL